MKDRTLILGCSNLFGAYDENDKFDITTSWVYKYFDPEYTDAFGFPGHGTITFCQFVDFLGPRLQDYDNLIVLETLEPRIIAGDYHKPIKEVFADMYAKKDKEIIVGMFQTDEDMESCNMLVPWRNDRFLSRYATSYRIGILKYAKETHQYIQRDNVQEHLTRSLTMYMKEYLKNRYINVHMLNHFRMAHKQNAPQVKNNWNKNGHANIILTNRINKKIYDELYEKGFIQRRGG